jgi:hypothetical protein
VARVLDEAVVDTLFFLVGWEWLGAIGRKITGFDLLDE